MTCPSCRAIVSRLSLIFSTPHHTVTCDDCGATLRIGWFGRVLTLFVAFMAATTTGQALRAGGFPDVVAVLGLAVVFVASYALAVGLLPRLQVVRRDGSRLG